MTPRPVPPRLERLEPRDVPATLFAVDAANHLVRFDSATPGTIARTVPITGLQSGEAVLGIDFRPADFRLYAVGSSNRLYTIDLTTGTAAPVAALAADPTDTTAPFTALSGTSFGVDFNPVPDRLRVVSNTGQNLRINPANGLVITDTDINPGTPTVVAAAHTNDFRGAVATTLYDLDSTANALEIQNPPNGGTLTMVGTGLGVDFGPDAGFDIETRAGVNTAYAALDVGGTTGLYTISLTTGAATLVGSVGPAGTALQGLAVEPAGFVATMDANGVVTFVGSPADDTLTIDSSGGLLHHNRFTAGDPGFSSDFDFDSTTAGDQTIAATSNIATLLIDPGPGTNTVNVTIPTVVAVVDVTRGTDHVTGADGLVTQKVLTYPDVDGDSVTLTVTRGTLGLGNFAFMPAEFLPGAPSGPGLQLIGVTLGPAFAGTNVTVAARRSAVGGDGFVNVGAINATGVDLGAASVHGDLGRIDAGDAADTRTGVGGLTVRSLGAFGLATQNGGGDLHSDVVGRLGFLRVAGDVRNATVNVTGGAIPANGSIGSVTVGGSVLGGAAADSGAILSTGSMGPVKVGRDIVGAGGTRSGAVDADGTLGPVAVGGSVLGGAGSNSGLVESTGDMGPVTIGGDVVGGTADHTGTVHGGGSIASVKVRGSVIGGATALGVLDAGLVYALTSGSPAAQNLGPVSVGGSLVGSPSQFGGSIYAHGNLAGVTVGGSAVGSTGLFSGDIFADTGRMGPVTIRGDLRGGGGNWSGSVVAFTSGPLAGVTVGGSVTGIGTATTGVLSAGQIGTVKIAGNLAGPAASGVQISAQGLLGPGLTAASALAIRSVSVGGRVENARILAGYDTLGDATNPDAQVGSVTVGGDWAASSLAAGVAAGVDGLFGTADDAAIAGGDAAIHSKVASVTIKGQAYGTFGGADHFGFVAQEIAKFSVGGAALPLKPGASNDVPPGTFDVGITGDLTMREVA
jgi:hypothetical protein